MRAELSVRGVASVPEAVAVRVARPVDSVLLPLASSDEATLGQFFDELSPSSRRTYSVIGPGRELAPEQARILA